MKLHHQTNQDYTLMTLKYSKLGMIMPIYKNMEKA